MGMLDMVKKAKENVKSGHDGEFLAKDQTGQLLVHSLTFFETDKGKWGALNAEIVESRARAQGAFVQAPGTKVKVLYKCHGDYPLIGYEGLYKAIKGIFGPADENEEKQAMRACFGSDESGYSSKASKEDRANPLFAARGVTVGFTTKASKSSPERVKAGKSEIVEVAFSHLEQTPEDIAARAAKLPEVS